MLTWIQFVTTSPPKTRAKVKNDIYEINDDDDDDDGDDDDGLPANSHHDKNPPWWEFVSNEYGGNMPVTNSHH